MAVFSRKPCTVFGAKQDITKVATGYYRELHVHFQLEKSVTLVDPEPLFYAL